MNSPRFPEVFDRHEFGNVSYCVFKHSGEVKLQIRKGLDARVFSENEMEELYRFLNRVKESS